jgi:peptide/nickel transport system ATP-binding protein
MTRRGTLIARPDGGTPSPGLEVRGLTVAYRRQGGGETTVVWDVDLDLRPGESVGLAGESGSGKSTTGLAAIGYRSPGMRVTDGSSRLADDDLLGLPPARLREIWGRRISYVAQDASRALNPAIPVGRQLAQPLKLHLGLRGAGLREKQLELLSAVDIPDPERALRRYPFQFSGGQQQRIAIAIALSCRPEVLVLDEPTTGLDVTTQARVSSLLRKLIAETGVATLYVSHDLSLLAGTVDRLMVMYGGEIVESGPTAQVATRPTHPYTQALLGAVPTLRSARAIEGIPGRPPLAVVLDRCSYSPRCTHATDACLQRIRLRQAAPNQLARCVRVEELTHRVSVETPIAVRATGGTLLEVDDLVCSYSKAPVPAVRGVSLTVHRSESLGIVGESGSGKSTLMRTIAGLHPQEAGEVRYGGKALSTVAAKRSRDLRHAIQLVFQNPDSSLNPRHTVAQLIRRPIELLRDDVRRADELAEVERVLAAVRLPRGILHKYPSQLSGGQKQRVAVARAFAARPALLLCDEVTSALDVSVQATIVKLISELAAEFGTAVIFVSHDLAVVRAVAQRVIVMKDGEICEEGEVERVFNAPEHPYTRQLLESVPDFEIPKAVGA